ncbi:MAG: CHAP domain-containing protein [Clostridia bacterium]|nr:CHAP domain-containing protein [Clostridia bacterium]
MKRLPAAIVAASLTLSIFTLPLAALTPTYTVTGAYKSSTYHQNILSITKTGDKALDTLAAALSQLNYHEGNSTADFNGKNTGGNKNYTEFNRYFGTISGSYSYAWCAAFVTWCLDMAGAINAAGGAFTSCTLWVERLQQLGLYSTRGSGYTPKPGDLIFFRSAGVSRASDHVGIVRYVKGGRVYTVEGNASNKVTLRDYALSDTYIVGYGKPKYDGKKLDKTALQLEDKATGLYTVTYDFVNLRSKPNASSTKLGSLTRGTLVKVEGIEAGFGKITYQGKTAYISLEYADFVTPVFYTVSYEAENAEGLPAKHSYFSFEQATVSETAPLREGHDFSHWQDKSGKKYLAGDKLPAGNSTLTAVFTRTPLPEAPETPESGEVPEQNAPQPPSNPTPEELPSTSAPSEEAARAAGIIFAVLMTAAALLWFGKKQTA